MIGEIVEEVVINSSLIVALQKGIEIKRKKCYNVHKNKKGKKKSVVLD